jgi:hypothetical protein
MSNTRLPCVQYVGVRVFCESVCAVVVIESL